MDKIQMVDLKKQYATIQDELDSRILSCVRSSAYINGPEVKLFTKAFSSYLQDAHVIPCANGTDALQIAMMSLGLDYGDEVIVPAFTYIATVEVLLLLGLKPVLVDVTSDFNIDVNTLDEALSSKTKAIIPVHLFGQSCNMDVIMEFAQKHDLFVIEDNAQSVGTDYIHSDGSLQKTGTIGDIGCVSFYPSKNLGCYGDGGALITRDEKRAAQLRQVANHGQSKTYHHEVIGVNSRLDSLQAVVLNVKLKRLDDYNRSRRAAADYYDVALGAVTNFSTPIRNNFSTHIFHQYTLTVNDGSRDDLKAFLKSKEIPSMIYYPLPVNEQEAFKDKVRIVGDLNMTYELCQSVISLPMHSNLSQKQLNYISSAVLDFYK